MIREGTHRPRPALSRPRPGRRPGVNADAFNITAHYAKLLALRQQSWLAGNRAARALRVRVMDGYVWRPRPPARGAGLARAASKACLRARASRQRDPQPQHLRIPAHPVSRLRSGFSPAGFSPRARRQPSRPPPRGLPEVKSAPRVCMRCKAKTRLATHDRASKTFAPSRLPCGATRPGRNPRPHSALPFSR